VKGLIVKTLTIYFTGNTGNYPEDLALPRDIEADIAKSLKLTSASNMTVVVASVPIYPLERMTKGSPEGEPMREEAAQVLNEVLANIAQKAAELAELGAENYSSTVADHF
jgi:hypothetical protein